MGILEPATVSPKYPGIKTAFLLTLFFNFNTQTAGQSCVQGSDAHPLAII